MSDRDADLREALVRVLAHTGLPPRPTLELMLGLNASIIRIVDEALAAHPRPTASPLDRLRGFRIVTDDSVPVNEIRVHSVTFNPPDPAPLLETVRIMLEPKAPTDG